MAELVDARDLKSLGAQALCRFDPGCPHQQNQQLSSDFDLSFCGCDLAFVNHPSTAHADLAPNK
jgi:hypothetical protein